MMNSHAEGKESVVSDITKDDGQRQLSLTDRRFHFLVPIIMPQCRSAL